MEFKIENGLFIFNRFFLNLSQKIMINFNLISYYSRLPKDKKKFISILLYPLKVLYNSWEEIQFNVYIFWGKGKNTEADIKVLYITSCKVAPYFISRLFEFTPELTFKKKVFLWKLKCTIEEQSKNIDIVMIDMHKFIKYFFKLEKAFLIPVWIKQVLDINKPLDEIINGFRKNTKLTDLRRIRKSGYSYDIFSDLDSLKLFYEKMHMPYIKSRYTDQAEIDDFDVVKKKFKNGELLFIKSNGEYVAAVLCVKKQGCYYWDRIGILNGDEEILKKGALAALLYFAIIRAKNENMKTIDFGNSRPFLSNGVLHYKRKWGSQVCQDKNIKRLIYLLVNKSKNIAPIFTEQPFLFVEKDKLKAVVFLNGEIKDAEFDINYLIEKFYSPGIASFKVVDLEKEREFATEFK
jgi:hypothetical protein